MWQSSHRAQKSIGSIASKAFASKAIASEILASKANTATVAGPPQSTAAFTNTIASAMHRGTNIGMSSTVIHRPTGGSNWQRRSVIVVRMSLYPSFHPITVIGIQPVTVLTDQMVYTVPNRNEYTPGTMLSIATPFLTNVDYLHQTLINHSF